MPATLMGASLIEAMLAGDRVVSGHRGFYAGTLPAVIRGLDDMPRTEGNPGKPIRAVTGPIRVVSYYYLAASRVFIGESPVLYS